MSSVLFDTSYMVALVDERDKWHGVASAIHDAMQSAGHHGIVVDPVINEVVGVLARRLHEQRRPQLFVACLDTLERIVPHNRITWISPAIPRLYGQIMTLVRLYDGQLNFIDALLALAGRELGIGQIVSFDHDFDRITWLTRVSSVEHLPS